jgi:hypothetical protein
MDPLVLDPGQSDRLAGLLVDLTAAAGLALTAAFALLLGHVMLPAFADAPADADQTGEERPHGNARPLRWLLDPLAAVAAIAMLVGLSRAVVSAVDVLQAVYPRFLI